MINDQTPRIFPMVNEVGVAGSHILGYHTGTQIWPRSDAEAIEMHFRLHDEGTFIDGFVHDHNLTPCRDIRHGTAGYRCTCENRQSLP